MLQDTLLGKPGSRSLDNYKVNCLFRVSQFLMICVDQTFTVTYKIYLLSHMSSNDLMVAICSSPHAFTFPTVLCRPAWKRLTDSRSATELTDSIKTWASSYLLALVYLIFIPPFFVWIQGGIQKNQNEQTLSTYCQTTSSVQMALHHYLSYLSNLFLLVSLVAKETGKLIVKICGKMEIEKRRGRERASVQ